MVENTLEHQHCATASCEFWPLQPREGFHLAVGFLIARVAGHTVLVKLQKLENAERNALVIHWYHPILLPGN